MSSEKKIKTANFCARKALSQFTVCCLLFTILSSPVFALGDLDTSVDAQIRKNYNPDKLEEDMSLPPLPRILKEKSIMSTEPKPAVISEPKASESGLAKSLPVNQVKPRENETYVDNTDSEAVTQNPTQPARINKNSINVNDQQYYAVLHRGTKFRLKLLSSISDKTKKGTRVSFISTYPVTTTYLTIPEGTVFKGKIVNTHGPQYSANGGLIVIEITSMVLNGETQPIIGYVTRADRKRIYFNNIKGKRKYLSSTFKSIKPGFHFFRKMIRVSGYLASDGSSIVVAPFSLLAGVVAVAGNIVVSPVLGLCHKGAPISINSGSEFFVRLKQDVYFYN